AIGYIYEAVTENLSNLATGFEVLYDVVAGVGYDVLTTESPSLATDLEALYWMARLNIVYENSDLKDFLDSDGDELEIGVDSSLAYTKGAGAIGQQDLRDLIQAVQDASQVDNLNGALALSNSAVIDLE